MDWQGFIGKSWFFYVFFLVLPLKYEVFLWDYHVKCRNEIVIFPAFPTDKVQKTRCAARSFLARICGRLALGKEFQGSPSGSSVLLCFNMFQPKQKNVAREE